MITLEHIVDVSGSRNWIRDKPHRNYGISTNSIYFYVRGPDSALEWYLSTCWASEPVRNHLSSFPPYEDPRIPRSYGLFTHVADGRGDHCSLLKCKCNREDLYGATYASNLVEPFLARGTEWLWPYLDKLYRHHFLGEPEPSLEFTYLPHPDDIKEGKT